MASVYLGGLVERKELLKTHSFRGDTLLKFTQKHPMGLQGLCEVPFPTHDYWQRLKYFIMLTAEKDAREEASSYTDMGNFSNLSWVFPD